MGVEDDLRTAMELGTREAQQRREQHAQKREQDEHERAERRRRSREQAEARSKLVSELRPLISRFLDAAAARGCRPETSQGLPPEATGFLLDVRTGVGRTAGSSRMRSGSLWLYEGLNVLLEAGSREPGPAFWFCRVKRQSHPAKGWDLTSWQRWVIGGENYSVNGVLPPELLQAEHRLPFAIGLRAAKLGLVL